MEKQENPFEDKKVSLLELALAITEKNIVKNGPITVKVYGRRNKKKSLKKQVTLHRDEHGEIFIYVKDNTHEQGLKGIKEKYKAEIKAFKANSSNKTITLCGQGK